MSSKFESSVTKDNGADANQAHSGVSRRGVLKAMAMAPAALAVGGLQAQTETSQGPTLALVSRHIQWTDWREGLRVAQEAGYPGIVWTVRGGAHVETANVKRDLPEIVETTRAAGLKVPMIITNIGNVRSPDIESILETMSSLGITNYRAGSPRYDYNQDFATQYEAFHREFQELANLNAKYGTRALFHTHSNQGGVGGPGWDLWMLMKDLDPRYIGINFDIGHITARTGSGWIDISHAARNHIQSLSLKDVRAWVPQAEAQAGRWPWDREFVPPGQGMVDFDRFFAYFKETNFTGPMEVYHEYSAPIPGSDEQINMLGTNYGSWQLEVSRDYFVSLLSRDVQFYKAGMRKAGFNI